MRIRKKIRITVPIYMNVSKSKTVLIGMNWFRNAFYRQSNSVKKEYHKIIASLGLTKLRGKLSVHYDIYMKRRGTDGMNVRAVIEKFVLDGFKSANVIEDDNFEIIVSDSSNYYLDRKNPRAVITIKEIDDDDNDRPQNTSKEVL
jgi:hypothetical protein